MPLMPPADKIDSLGDRPLTAPERDLARWLLEHGDAGAAAFLGQLERAEATSWRCPCGCPSLNFSVPGLPPAPPSVHVLADFMYGSGDDLKGIFVYEQAGILSSLEVFAYGGDHPTTLPGIAELRPAGKPDEG